MATKLIIKIPEGTDPQDTYDEVEESLGMWSTRIQHLFDGVMYDIKVVDDTVVVTDFVTPGVANEAEECLDDDGIENTRMEE